MYVHYELNNSNPLLDLLVQTTVDYVMDDLDLHDVPGSIMISTVDHIEVPEYLDYVYGEAGVIDGIHDISILSTLTVKEVINVVAHELRHVWQRVHGWDMYSTLPYMQRPYEIDAFQYNTQFYSRMGMAVYNAYLAKKLVAA